MSDLKIEQWDIEKLIPYARNPRKNDDQVERMASAIREFGFKIPILSKSDGTVIDGHLRLKAAKLLGLQTLPVVVADDLSDAQIKAFRLLANKSVEWAAWDDELLKLEFQDLSEMGFDLEQTGFDAATISNLLNPDGIQGLTDPDDAPGLPETPKTQPGDLYILGGHRLLCGDSTSADDVGKLLGQVTPLLMVTDPPYGVNYDPDWRNRADRSNGKSIGARAIGKVANDGNADWTEAWALFPGDVVYVWHAGNKAHIVAQSLEESNFGIRAQIVWVKQRHVISRGHYHGQHEPCFYGVRSEASDDNWRFVPEHEILEYAVKESKTGNWQGSRKQSTVWFIEHLKSDTGHGTQKPVECMKRPITNNSSPGQVVYDPFLGSGTTLIAAEMTGRCCYGMEIDPKYCDVIVKRWEDFTGKKAELINGPART